MLSTYTKAVNSVIGIFTKTPKSILDLKNSHSTPPRLSLIRVYIDGNIADLQFNKEWKIHPKSTELFKRYSA